jgi:hypothetical protein
LARRAAYNSKFRYVRRSINDFRCAASIREIAYERGGFALFRAWFRIDSVLELSKYLARLFDTAPVDRRSTKHPGFSVIAKLIAALD